MDRQAIWLCALAASALLVGPAAASAADQRPNILWITCEDIGPHLGCYGDRYADTPNLDRLASRGMLYLYCWSNAPVCAPARTAIISGMYPTSTGSEHMRSITRLPQGMLMYPQLLRRAGYYCTNNVKEDYNLKKPGQVWDESSRKAHWKNRRPGQPFFAIFNYTNTHESRIRTRPHQWVHDPAQAPVPAYHPDTLAVRRDWAQYYDNITVLDGLVAQRLRELEEAGLADETIVFFYGDHGSGMPRSKRWPYNSGLHVPLIVYIPPKFRHLAPDEYQPGARSARLVSFVDLAPTLLSLAGVRPPRYMQGHAFMGKHEDAPQPYIFGFRGRMDERYDMVRSVRDQRYIYIRNYMPHLIYGQHVAYMFITPTTRVWKELYDQGKLTPEQARFWQPKPPEELYDLQADPDEVHNLADSPDHQEILGRMRTALRQWMLEVRDVGFLPEHEIHSRSRGRSPYEVGHDPAAYPLERIMATAELASSLKPEVLPRLQQALGDEDSAVRYWAASGILMRGSAAVRQCRDALVDALHDPAPCVEIAAAWALGQYGSDADARQALNVLLKYASYEENGVYLPLLALNALDYVDERAFEALDTIKALPTEVKPRDRRPGYGIRRLVEKIVADLQP
ncbi:MAG TPA: sulfatase [Planctomycetaceae bacterium]|nr:sulfatase [Planctomycetaceae bacterium]